ncbi:MAG TPA: acetamidase/formamidase family protein [Vicinamibacterales bacterium]|jgi:acetamidase/formamidase|nr:acetamidase/formamidase family protein [Vicinamibacterales bacterium]
MRRSIVPALSCCLLAVGATASAQRVVRYEPKDSDLKYVFGVAQPVATVKPGEIIETRTADCFGNVIQKPGDTLAKVKGDNPLTGPFFIEGAEPGDTLAVTILELTIDSDQGIGALAPGFGALNTTNYTPMLHPPVPEKIWFFPIDRARNEATFKALDSSFSTKIPLHPFLGCLGVSPALESRSSVTPAEHGGNMDAPEASVGHTAYFPVTVRGALLYLGDGHAAMGDGEIAGTAIEVPMRARLRVDLIKGQTIRWPRFENAQSIMAVGAYRPLDDALRIAFTELIGWIHAETGLSELDAYQLLSQVGRVHLTEMVDPNYVVIAIADKKFLPPRKNGKPW